MSKLAVAVIGYGYWGPNLVRNFTSCPLTEVVAVCDPDPVRREACARSYGHIHTVASVDELMEIPFDAVAIATPVSTHFPLAQRCLEDGKHVWVEKPLAASVAEGRALVDLAARRGRLLMVDHTYLFTNAVRRIKELIENDELGELYFVDSVRINLGLYQRDVNVIWDLAPHDLSIVDHLVPAAPRSIAAWGCGHADLGKEDIAYINVDLGECLLATFHVSWLAPLKMRQMIFTGSRKSLVFNELNPTEPIKVYDRSIEVRADSAEERQRLQVSYRSGDIWSPHIAPGEALQAAVTHFAECIRDGTSPLSDGVLGLRVVQLIEAANRSIRAQGGRVVLSPDKLHQGNGHARTQRSHELSTSRPGCTPGAERPDSLLRQPLRLSGGG
jgi:predicted dehydrogenase